MKRAELLVPMILLLSALSGVPVVYVQGAQGQEDISDQAIFDDKQLLDGYAQKYRGLPQEVIVEMLKDDTLNSYQVAAVIRVYKEKYSNEAVAREKAQMEKILIRRLKLTDSPFVEVEILHTLCRMDRYRYFDAMVPALIQKLNHYNAAVNEMAFDSINDIIGQGNKRAREARVVFNTLRKMLFLSRNRLVNVIEPDPKLANKLKLLRWSVKVLGSQELNKLPREVIILL